MMRMIGLVAALVLAGCGEASKPVTMEKVGDPTPVPAPAPVMIPAEATTPEPASPEPGETGEGQPVASLPAEVLAFRERRDECDHFRGEDPYDAERGAFLSAALERTCTGTDAELKTLRTRYAADAIVLAALADYEDQAE